MLLQNQSNTGNFNKLIYIKFKRNQKETILTNQLVRGDKTILNRCVEIKRILISSINTAKVKEK